MLTPKEPNIARPGLSIDMFPVLPRQARRTGDRPAWRLDARLLRILLIILLFTVEACTGKKDTSPLVSPGIEKRKPGSDSLAIHTWDPAEIKSYLDECATGVDAENVSPRQVGEFCQCMLYQAQLHYAHYRDIEEDSLGLHDSAILDSCAGHLPQEQ